MRNYFLKAKTFISHRKKTTVGALILLILLIVGWNLFAPKSNQVQYQTATVTKGTLITSVSASGTVTVANKAAVTTQASGVINQVMVKNGDKVQAGETIATITLDQSGQQKQAAAWSAYLTAQDTLNSANATYYTLQSNLFSAWNNFTILAENSTYQNADGSPNTTNRTLPAFTTVQNTWLATEAQDKNQQGVIAQAQSSVSSAYLSYQAVSSTITAPISGVISDLTVTPGMQIAGGTTSTTSTTTTTTTTDSGQEIASIATGGTPILSLSIAEVDSPKVTVGQNATLVFDALPTQTFTGKIIGINTTGQVSSGVTVYPATIVLDTANSKILPNMNVTANIITKVDPNVLLVPSAAVQTSANGSTVRVLRNGQVTAIPVQTGDNSDTQTQITSGLSEGETVVTGMLSTGTSSSGNTTSPFSGGLRFGGGFGGGGVVRTGGGAGSGRGG